MIAGPLIAAKFGVQALFWMAALVRLAAAAAAARNPETGTRESWSLLPALRADLLRIDFYFFLLHAIMTATFVALPFLLSDRLGMPLTDALEDVHRRLPYRSSSRYR